MREQVLTPGSIVMIDDVLGPADLSAALNLIEGTSFEQANLGNRIWAKNKLNPGIGSWFIWPNRADSIDPTADSQPLVATGRKGHHTQFLRYPTSSPFDRILEAARGAAERYSLVSSDTPEDPYAGLIGSLFSYDSGSRLVWHTDGEYLAAFAAFLSPNWPENGGGYFAYYSDDANTRNGVGHIVEPRENRLLVFAGGIRHSVLTVARDVERPRVSLSGFFIKRSHLARIKTTSLMLTMREQVATVG